jgi:hypothetical protein
MKYKLANFLETGFSNQPFFDVSGSIKLILAYVGRELGLQLFLLHSAIFVLTFAGPVLAQESTNVTVKSDADYQFGQVMHFSIEAESDTPIEKVTLFVSAPELPHTLSSDIQIEPGKIVSAKQSIDLTQYRLAPFTTVTYWWWLEDEDGTVYRAPDEQVDYVDTQYSWNELERDDVIVYWTGEEAGVGQAAMDALTESLPGQQLLIPFDPPKPLRVFVYPSADDLQAALRLTGRNWVGAHAHPELGVILVSATNPRTAAVELEQSIPHELTHLLLYEALGANYEMIPLWFEEGLATFFESGANGNYDSILNESVLSGTTIPLDELCRTFDNDSRSAILAYAQSVSLVHYIQDVYGNNALNQMIRAVADGADCQTITTRVLGLTLEELNQQWLDSLSPQSAPERLWRQGGFIIVAIVVGFILMSLFFFGLPKAKA